MKILFLYDFPLWGSGSGTYLRNLVQELTRLNHKVGIVAPDNRRFLEDKIKQYQVNLQQIPVFIGHPELKGAKRYSELSSREITDIYKAFLDTSLEAVSNFEPDIIHVHHLSIIAWVARYLQALKGVKYIITTHGSCLSNLKNNKKYLSLSEDAIRNAKAITTVSGITRSAFLKTFGKAYAKNFHVISGGVDIKLFNKKPELAKIDEQHNLKDKKVVLFCGRLTSEKGAKYLIQAAKSIKAEVVIVGEGPERKFLEDTVKQKNINNVHLVGYMPHEDIIDFYFRADVFVAPSVVEEALGLSILEAMAAKTPVIATRKGGIPLLVKHNQNGLFVRPRNSQAIADACNKLLDNDELRNKFAEQARKTIEEKFNWKTIAEQFDKLYHKYGNGNGKSKK